MRRRPVPLLISPEQSTTTRVEIAKSIGLGNAEKCYLIAKMDLPLVGREKETPFIATFEFPQWYLASQGNFLGFDDLGPPPSSPPFGTGPPPLHLRLELIHSYGELR